MTDMVDLYNELNYYICQNICNFNQKVTWQLITDAFCVPLSHFESVLPYWGFSLVRHL